MKKPVFPMLSGFKGNSHQNYQEIQIKRKIRESVRKVLENPLLRTTKKWSADAIALHFCAWLSVCAGVAGSPAQTDMLRKTE